MVTGTCGACSVAISEEVERTTSRLLATLDDSRRVRLDEIYAGEPPDQMCAPCFIANVGSLNAGAVATP